MGKKMSRQEEIRLALQNVFDPAQLEVTDESEQHRGHAGYQEGGQSHFHVLIRADDFVGQSRIARHRAIYNALGPEMIGQIHALSLDIDVP